MVEDLSAFGGPILPGAIEGNDLYVKIWKSIEEIETPVAFNIDSCSGTFNGLFSAISEIYLVSLLLLFFGVFALDGLE